MKYHHDGDVGIDVTVPTQDLEDLIDKATNAALTIITALTVSHIIKSIFNRRES